MSILTSKGRALRLGAKLLARAVASTLPPDPEIPGSGTITLAEPVNFTVHQHVNGSKIVTAGATFTGDVTLLEVRAVPIALDGTLDASKATAWTPIATDVSAKTGSGPAQIPEGGWYVWQARDAIKTGITATGANRWGVGEVVLWIGQSNAENSPETPDKYPSGDPRAVEYVLVGTAKTKVLRRLGTYADQKPPNTLFSGTGGYGSNWSGAGSRGDGYVFFANLLSQGRNVPVLIIQRAVGGTAIESWLAPGGHLQTAIAAVNEVGGSCGLAMWYQGEANADSATSEGAYFGSLGTLHSRLKTAFGQDIKLGVVALAAISDSQYTDGTETQVPAIRRAQIRYANETPGAFLAATGCDLYTGDAVHLHKSSYSISGRRHAKSALAALGIGKTAAGPRIAGAARAGLDVDVTIAHTGGTALSDGAGGNGSALAGFRFFDNGVPLAYTSSSIINATTIRLRLASAPTGVLTMDFAQTNAPFHADPTNSRVPAVEASIVYDNAYYHGSSITATFALSTVGCPLQPCPAITITGS
ncbi:sialate O-acetylesterase [Massilia sp. BKSP1R2A-1]|uniref:sialate O-acetylesterase n=1 Tax=Massilia sp. BKSP1R2A-1 TaxID=3422595 RepID=UPI003D34EED7